MILLGLASKARHGKNTFATYLIEAFEKEHNKVFIEGAFAESLKSMCKDYFDLSEEQLWGDEKEMPDQRYPKSVQSTDDSSILYWTPREIMQSMGSFFRFIDHDFWIKVLDKKINVLNDVNVIITDVRYSNECEYIKENGVLIKIVRDGAAEIHGMDHESETSLDSKPSDYFDIVINNSGSLEDLRIAAFNTARIILELIKLKNKERQHNG